MHSGHVSAHAHPGRALGACARGSPMLAGACCARPAQVRKRAGFDPDDVLPIRPAIDRGVGGGHVRRPDVPDSMPSHVMRVYDLMCCVRS